MSGTVEIKLTARGLTVTIGGQTTTVADIEQAIEFARQHLERAEHVRQLSYRCE